MSPMEAMALVRLAQEQSDLLAVPVSKRLLAAADARGYSDPDLAVKEACVALYGELKSLQSGMMGVGFAPPSGTATGC